MFLYESAAQEAKNSLKHETNTSDLIERKRQDGMLIFQFVCKLPACG